MSDRDAQISQAYGRSAQRYVQLVGDRISDDFEAAPDQALLHTFSDGLPPGLVVDAGCGVGRLTRWLHDRGHRVLGTDLATEMVEQARVAHPMIDFDVAPLVAQPVDDGSAVAMTLWYSIIATPPDELPPVWEEVRRVTGGGSVLVAFQAGDGSSDIIDDAYSTGAVLELFRHRVDHVASGLEAQGYSVRSTQRPPLLAHEAHPQAFVWATAQG